MMDRRFFVRGMSAAALLAKSRCSSAEMLPGGIDAAPVRLGVIGPGSRGKELARCFAGVPGVTIVAAANANQHRFTELNQACGYVVESHRHYRSLVDRKDLDAVVIASPAHLHAEHAFAALKRGHHVYGEKMMAFTVDEAKELVRVVDTGKQVFQVGHQYRYAPWIQAGVERVRQGEIGEVTHVFGYWYRNGGTRSPLRNEYSPGILGELGSHHIDVANWIFDEIPQTALATSRSDDNIQAMLSYSKGRRFIFSSITDNAKSGDQLWIYGTRGTVNLKLHDAGSAEDPTSAACRAFINCIRTGARPIADVRIGLASALEVIVANQSIEERKELDIPSAGQAIGALTC